MIEQQIFGAERILIVGAHAFDGEMIAGPLAFVAASRGIEVTFLHLTMGEQGHRCLSTSLYAEQKRKEAADAASRLGAKWLTLDFPDAFLPNDEQTALAVCDVIRRIRPNVVITHWHGSWHKDHRAASELTKTGVFYAALPTLERESPAFSPSLLLFGENWEDDEGFTPTYLVDVSSGFEPWREAASTYELARGLSSFPYLDYYSALYRLRGCLRGTMYAQAFMGMSHSWNAGAGLFLPPQPA
ncbi:PIG-L family deacetylase [Devosia sp. ZB163]|uniref:PIG-L deacetylase family protein n=1 Tax=Devosia sp. ZB163 TaxID=3025938 RepID=UPI0023626573|nr:PIG-L deacetylase family protein [Devosia sp. ZB163]MDC9825311.1 PIG-L family deacetylase [Devosia sp. ZB163]